MGKGGGIAMYVKSRFISSVTLSIAKAKQFEVLAIKVGASKDSNITVVGCHRPSPASKDAFKSISDLLHELNKSGFIPMGDLNLDWLSWTSDCFKELHDCLNLVHLINAPARPILNLPCLI